MNKIIIDLEFTDLPFAGHMPDISQVKVLNLTNEKSCLVNFKHEADHIHEDIHGKIPQGKVVFTKKEFEKILKNVGGNLDDEFYGFTIDTDKRILQQKGIFIKHYFDIKEMLYLNSEMELKMAKYGNSMNLCHYFISKNKDDLKLDHNDLRELFFIKDLYVFGVQHQNQKYMSLWPRRDQNCGRKLVDLVKEGNSACGYRFYHDDLLAKSLNRLYYDKCYY